MTLEDILKYKEVKPDHFNFVDKEGVINGKLKVLFYAGRGSSNKVRWACLCECGNYCLTLTSNLAPSNSKLNCGCSPLKKKPYLSVEERTSIIREVTGYSVIDSSKGRSYDKWTFTCTENHEFSSRWCKVAIEGTRCPYCSRNGAKKVTGGHFYINAVINSSDEIIAYKYGVTSKNNDVRIKQIENASIYKLSNHFSIPVNKASLLLQLESDFSKKFGKKYLTKSEMLDGYTETVPADNFESYLLWVTEYLSSRNHLSN